jgi:hypothetical protein
MENQSKVSEHAIGAVCVQLTPHDFGGTAKGHHFFSAYCFTIPYIQKHI